MCDGGADETSVASSPYQSGTRDAGLSGVHSIKKQRAALAQLEKMASQFANEKRTAVLRACCVDSAGLNGKA
jgi:hypothetical protein